MKKYLPLFLCLLLSSCVYTKEQRRKPGDALQKLITGNERYKNEQSICSDRFKRRGSFASKEKPFAVIIGCTDSNVAPEIIFDQEIEELFLVQAVGNVVGPHELDSIEDAVNHLRASVIVVLGHENCSAIEAALAGQGSDIELAAEVKRNIKMSNDKKISLEQAIKKNVQVVVGQLESNPGFFRLVLDNKLSIVGGYYHSSTGEVELLRDSR
ncbi:MAG TPA: carbonic anhydrase [Waddliaceae bacterium]